MISRIATSRNSNSRFPTARLLRTLLVAGALLAASAACPPGKLIGSGAGKQGAALAQGLGTATPPTAIQQFAPQGPASPADRPVVALLLPLSGAGAALGQPMLDAALMALFDMAGPDFVLRPYDTRSTPQSAVAAAQAALDDGARLILGPVFGSAAHAIAPHSRAAGVNVVSFSNDATVAGDGVYVMGFLPRDQVRRIIDHAVSTGITRFAALAPENEFGVALVQEMRRAVEQNAATLARVAFYDPNAGDVQPIVRDLADYDQRKRALQRQRAELAAKDDRFSKQALKRLEGLETIGDVDFGAVMIAESGDRLRAVASLLPLYDIDPAKVRFLGNVLWNDPALAAEPALRGAWLPGPPQAVRANFDQRYAAAYGTPPPRLASLAYDAVALAAVLARAPGGPRFDRATLENQAGFAGVDGIFRFDGAGAIERGFAILEIDADGVHEIVPAPEVFPDAPATAAIEAPPPGTETTISGLPGAQPGATAGAVPPTGAAAANGAADQATLPPSAATLPPPDLDGPYPPQTNPARFAERPQS